MWKLEQQLQNNLFASGPIIWLRRWEGSDEAETIADWFDFSPSNIKLKKIYLLHLFIWLPTSSVYNPMWRRDKRSLDEMRQASQGFLTDDGLYCY